MFGRSVGDSPAKLGEGVRSAATAMVGFQCNTPAQIRTDANYARRRYLYLPNKHAKIRKASRSSAVRSSSSYVTSSNKERAKGQVWARTNHVRAVDRQTELSKNNRSSLIAQKRLDANGTV